MAVDRIDQRLGVGAVPAGTVLGDLVRSGGISDQCAARRIHARQALAAASGTAAHRKSAAGVENHHVQAILGPFEAGEDVLQADAGRADVILVDDVRIDRDHEVLAVCLRTVAGVVKEPDPAVGERFSKLADRSEHVLPGAVLHPDDLEAIPRKRVGHCAGVIERIGE